MSLLEKDTCCLCAVRLLEKEQCASESVGHADRVWCCKESREALNIGPFMAGQFFLLYVRCRCEVYVPTSNLSLMSGQSNNQASHACPNPADMSVGTL